MELTFYLNGDFVKASEAKFSIYDHGFLYGDGLFETIRVYQNKIFQFDRHLDRLFAGLKKLEIKEPQDRDSIHKVTKMLLNINGLDDSVVRITVTRGEGDFGLAKSLCPNPSLLITVSPVKQHSEDLYKLGIDCMVVSIRKPPIQSIPSDIKSLNMLNSILAKEEALKNKCFEGVMLNIEGYVTEGATSNLFCLSNGRLITPDLSCGVLAGITREVVMNLAKSIGLDIFEGFLTPQELYSATECFLTSTLMEIMPVVSCDGKRIGKGVPGEITKELQRKFKNLIKRQIAEEDTELTKILTER